MQARWIYDSGDDAEIRAPSSGSENVKSCVLGSLESSSGTWRHHWASHDNSLSRTPPRTRAKSSAGLETISKPESEEEEIENYLQCGPSDEDGDTDASSIVWSPQNTENYDESDEDRPSSYSWKERLDKTVYLDNAQLLDDGLNNSAADSFLHGPIPDPIPQALASREQTLARIQG